MAIKTGTPVRVIQPEIVGTVVERRIDKGTDEELARVEYIDQAGDEHNRWFPVATLEEVQP